MLYQNWLEVGKAENKVTQKWSLSFSPDYVSSVERPAHLSPGDHPLTGQAGWRSFRFLLILWLWHYSQGFTVINPAGEAVSYKWLPVHRESLPGLQVTPAVGAPSQLPLRKASAPASVQRSPAWHPTELIPPWAQNPRRCWAKYSGEIWKTKLVDSRCSFDPSASSMTKTGSEKMGAEENEIGKIEY